MPIADTKIIPADVAGISAAARLILAGQPVAVPTETVYGLAADATDPEAVARIYEAKGRPRFNPLIVHVPDLESAEQIGVFDEAARALAVEHWPGPLTLVVPLKEDPRIAGIVTAGLATIGIRVPSHPAMQALLRAVMRPLAAPSANASGSISPTRAEHVAKSLGGRIPLILDGGTCERGIESTIIAATGGRLRLLRPGPITVADAVPAKGGKVEAPGMLASHYAPAKALRLDATDAELDEYLIGYGQTRGDYWLGNDTISAAAKLFDALHWADASAKSRIAIAPIPMEGLGGAINDRLKRAAA